MLDHAPAQKFTLESFRSTSKSYGLTDAWIEEIEWTTWDLLKGGDAGPISIPIRLHEVAKRIGITLKEGEFESRSITGIYREGAKSICVRRDEPYTRRAFIASRMMARVVLHNCKSISTFSSSEMKEPKTREELEENLFAVCLLLPRVVLKTLTKFGRVVDYFQVADLFSVSPKIARKRLDFLGIQVT